MRAKFDNGDRILVCIEPTDPCYPTYAARLLEAGAAGGHSLQETKDASGHEHKGSGPGGGQFTSGGGEGSASTTTEVDVPDPHQDLHAEVEAGVPAPAWKRAVALGMKAEHFAKDKISDGVDKLPRPMGFAVRGITKLAFASYLLAQKAADGIAKEKGLGEAQREKLGKTLAVIDVVGGGKLLPLGLTSVGLGALAPAGSFVPVGSLAYIGWSTARNPLATLRAARNGIKGAIAKFGKKAGASESWVQESDMGNPMSEIADRVKELGEDYDSWNACFLVALGETGDLKKAIKLADQVHPTMPKDDEVQEGKEIRHDDDEDPEEKNGLIADILAGIFGEDKALELFEENGLQEGWVREGRRWSLLELPDGRYLLLEWDASLHPRGQNGRFIEKGSAEAVGATKEAIGRALKGKKTAESHKEITEHLALLTIKQLHGLKQEYGLKASAKNRAALIAKLSERLDKGRRTEPEPEPIKPPEPEPIKPPSPKKKKEKKKPVLDMTKTAPGLTPWQQGMALEAQKLFNGKDGEYWKEFTLSRMEKVESSPSLQKVLKTAADLMEKEASREKFHEETLKKYNEIIETHKQYDHPEAKALREKLEESNRAKKAHKLEVRSAMWDSLREHLKSSGVAAPETVRLNVPRKTREELPLQTGVAERVLAGSLHPTLAKRVQETKVVNGGKGVRAYYSASGDKVVLDPNDGPEVMLHELGHALEEEPRIKLASRGFLSHRVQGEHFTHMGSGFDPHELGAEDDFAKVFGKRSGKYVGKYYPFGSTEVISMGLQQMYEDPGLFAAKDPEYFRFMVAVMDGTFLRENNK